nr:hypothetical protein [uncultured Blautia sp.]
MAKEKEARRPFNLKKEVKLLPGYIILLLWVIFTIALLGWVFGAGQYQLFAIVKSIM